MNFDFYLLKTKIANTGLYAHYVFNTLDSDHSGIVSFEVRTPSLIIIRNIEMDETNDVHISTQHGNTILDLFQNSIQSTKVWHSNQSKLPLIYSIKIGVEISYRIITLYKNASYKCFWFVYYARHTKQKPTTKQPLLDVYGSDYRSHMLKMSF